MWCLKLTSVFLAVLAYGSLVSSEDTEEIAKGDPSEEGAWPWAGVIVNIEASVFFGATLLSPYKVLTSAKYINPRAPPGTYIAAFGVADFTNESNFVNLQTNEIREFFVHPQYNPATGQNDLAIAYLVDPITVTPFVQPVQQISTAELDKKILRKNIKCVITGYGYSVANALWSVVGKLQELYVNPIDLEECSFLLQRIDYVDFTNVCTNNKKGGFCRGDTGGSLMCRMEGIWTLVAVQARNNDYDGCKSGTMVYTRASTFRSWFTHRD